MISEGDDAPRFELPALVDGDHRRVALDDYLGDDVIVLAFYPGDFNPACDEESDLDELDLFTMQKDVTVLGISADTLYSHAAFADEYDLHIPLLSDTRREVAQLYGVTFEDAVGQSLIARAVFVVDHDGVVQYAWSTESPLALPNADAIKDAIGDTGGDDTAFARYRVGHAHYTEARRAFTSAMGSFQNSEWMLSQSNFMRAKEEFEEAAEHFDTAVRFVDDDDLQVYYEQAEEKATALWQAAEWLTQSASNYSSGAGAEGQQLREDAERPLETARDLGEPIDPDDWPPDIDADDEESILPTEETSETELAVDIDAAAAENEAENAATGDPSDADAADGEGDDQDEIDDAELEEIEAELAANQPDDPEGEAIEETPTSMVDAPPGDESEEIDEDDLAELAADMAASQSAAEDEAAEPTPEDDDAPPDPDADLGSAGSTDLEPSDDDEADVPPPGSGSLEPAGGSASSDTGGESLDDETALDEPDGASDEEMDAIPDTEDLEEPDGATDEDMAAIPTEDELADEDETDDEDGDEDDTNGDETW